MKSRRAFLKLIATGSAAALATSATTVATTAATAATAARRSRTAPASAPRTAAVAAEVNKQKRYTAATLKVIRSFQLPPGSEPGFVFAPVPPVAKSRITGRTGTTRRPKAQP